MNKTENFIVKAMKIHSDKFDYSQVDYKTGNTNITIICKTHGSFLQTPKTHLRGFGCSKCSGLHKLDTATFVSKATIIHSNKYTYDFSNYINSKTKLIITCSKHGNFLQAPNHHLNGKGCVKCRNEKLSCKFSSNTDEFVTKALSTHYGKYDYSNVQYVNNRTKVKIICNEHGEFLQTPNQHLSGHGCKQCADLSSLTKRFKYYSNTPTTFYIIKYKGLYKLGITTKPILYRYSQEVDKLSDIEIVTEKLFNNYKDAYEFEQTELEKHKEYSYTGISPFKNTGITEIVTKILDME